MSASLIGADGTTIATTINGVPVSTPHVFTRLGGTTAQPNSVGALAFYSENDAGTITGNKYLKSPMTTDDNRLMVGLDTPMFNYTFNATAQNTAVWKFQQATTVMTGAEAGGFLTLNASSVLTANAACSYSTATQFTLMGNAGMHVEVTINPSLTVLANQVFEFGLFQSTATGATPTAPLDGAYFRITNAGVIGITNYNGVETPTSTFAALTVGANTELSIVITEREVQFWREGILLAEVAVPSGQGQPFLSNALPLTMQSRNTGTVTGSISLARYSDCHIDQRDLALGKPFTHIAAKMGQNGTQGQQGGTMGSTAILTNAATAAAAALVNTTAAAQFTGLGGHFLVLPTLAAGTDGILDAYQNPVGGVNQTARTLKITGVWVSAAVAGSIALTGGPLVYAMSLFYGSTAVSLATTESASFVSPTTKAPRRVPLQILSCVAAAPAGTALAGALYIGFATPIAVNPGEWVGIAARNQGVVTTLGSVAFNVGFDVMAD